ncbi:MULTISPECIES: arginase [unclassified Paenibacillus]|uniref:arginase n=1 Tax=unclassified Paenibacillus TaxID=185978 RepID=UPI00135CB8E4|nr:MULTISPECIES: arginase [unclassified Paenibacillus]MDR9857051.1 arginase [Paenibacillus sp. VCA1]
MSQPSISIIRVPFGLGAGRPGSENGPDSIMKFGLAKKLAGLGYDVQADSSIRLPDGIRSPAGAKMKHVQEVLAVSGLLGEAVSKAVAGGRVPLILGGDHSIAIGSLAGLTRHYGKMGVIWVDAHSDLNTESTSPSGNMHGISLAVGLGLSHIKLKDIVEGAASIQAENCVIIGARDLDRDEKELIRSCGLTCFTMHEIDRVGIEKVVHEALQIAGAGTDGVHLSFDVDSVDPIEAPGTGTPVRGGLSYREAHLLLELLSESGRITSADFVEVNPLLDRNNQTSKLAVELIGSLFGSRIL